MSLTPEQEKAVNYRETSLVLTSGAGCGKTHVLTARYLSYLEVDAAEIGQIVAITFTERAARQMRGRIRQAIIARLEHASDDEAEYWEQRLRDLESAQISTIHSFCANLLRQHAIEAGLDPRFEVLEDFLAKNLEREALRDGLQRLLTAETQAGEDLRHLVYLYGWRPVVEAVGGLMHCTDDGIQDQWIELPSEAVVTRWHEFARESVLPRIVRYLMEGNPKTASCLWLLDNTPCSGPRMQANITELKDCLASLHTGADLPTAIARIKKAARVQGTEAAKAWPSDAVYERVKDALTSFREEIDRRLKIFAEPGENLEQAVRVGQQFLRVAREVRKTFTQLKRRHGVVDFDDLMILARDLLRDHASVRERLQRRYRFLLMDELQDTDPVQMELVHYLAGAGLTEGRLFAVGDQAQSIYRFRGADVHLFQDLRRRMPYEGRLDLTMNFRSQPALLHFVNVLFSGDEQYQKLRAHRQPIHPGPCIEFLWAPKPEDGDISDARASEADWIARRIAGMIANGEKLVAERNGDHEIVHPVQAGDIIILFRAMTNVEIYEAALREHGLNYYLVGGRAFFAQQELYDLLNLLRALENPQDAVSMAGSLRSPFFCLSDESLFVLARHPDGLWSGLLDRSLEAALPSEQRQRVARTRKFLQHWRELKDRLPIARLLDKIFADSGYDAAMQFEFLGERKLANLWKLQDLARQFDRSRLFGLAEFIGRLDELVRTQPREEQAATQPENANVVRLMSVHQAKGLEFPVVIIADMAASGRGSSHPLAVWDDQLGCIVRPPDEDPPSFGAFGRQLWEEQEKIADWQEELRTLYVACTRAEDYLILSTSLAANQQPQGPWMFALANRFDLHSGRCLDPSWPADETPAIRVINEQCEPPDIRLSKEAIYDELPVVSEKIVAELWKPSKRDGVPEQPCHAQQWDSEDGGDRNQWG